MKYSYLLFLFVLVTTIAKSQNTFPSTGNVGIGTTNPIGKLQVTDNDRNFYVNRRIDGATEDAQGINYLLLHKVYSDVLIEDHYVMGKITAVRGGIGSWNRKFSVDINTASAYNSNRGSLISYMEMCKLVTVKYDNDIYLAIAISNESSLYTFSFTGYAFNETLQLVYDQDVSNVATFLSYETLSTVMPIHINKPLENNTTALILGMVNDAGNINVPLNASTGGYNIDFRTWRDVRPDQTGARIRAERINTCSPGNALFQAMDLTFQTSDGIEPQNLSEKMRIRNDGNVGIGTPTPTEKLSVNGNIRSKKIIVSASPWPDYVFNTNYDLPALDSVEQYIRQYKHLSDIPDAGTVAKEGLDVGEMQKQIVKKLEEITLYLIELKHENENLKKEISTLKAAR
jgi:hypothetical protein